MARLEYEGELVIGDAPTGTSSGATGTASFAAFNRNIGSGVETFSGYKKVPQQKKHVLGHAIPGRGAQKRRVRSKLVQSCRHPEAVYDDQHPFSAMEAAEACARDA
jgi:hypothetical protein